MEFEECMKMAGFCSASHILLFFPCLNYQTGNYIPGLEMCHVPIDFVKD